MKKSLFVVTMLAVGLFSWTGCDEKQEQSSLDFDSITETVTISGTAVYSTGVDVNSSDYSIVVEKPAAGRNVFVEVANSQYITGASGTKIYETVTGENGEFSIEIPTIAKGINATLRLEEFTDYYSEYDKMENGKPVFTTRLNRYDFTKTLNSLKPGAYQFPEKSLYDNTVIDLEAYDETVTLKGNIMLAIEKGFCDGAFTAANGSDVEFEITYDAGTSSAVTIKFGTTTDAEGNYSIKIPAKSLSDGFEVSKIKVRGIGNDAYVHYTAADGSNITLQGAYELKNIVGTGITLTDIISGMDYNIGKQYLYFTPNFNGNITTVANPSTWHNDLAGWAIGNGDFDESYIDTITLTGRILFAEQTGYAQGVYAGRKQIISIQGDNDPYLAGFTAISDEDGAFAIKIPVQDKSVNPGVDFSLTLDDNKIPFTFYKKDGKSVQLNDGAYNTSYTNIKKEGAAWNELGDYYFAYNPATGNTPDGWSNDLVGWKVFQNYDYSATITGGLFFSYESEFATGAYKGAEKELAKVTVAYSAPVGSQTFVVPVAANGSFNFNIPLKEETDQPAVAFVNGTYSTTEFVHYPAFGSTDFKMLKGNYAIYNNGTEDVIVKDKDAAWNVLGNHYYKFAPTTAPTTWHADLAGWFKKLNFDKSVAASGSAYFAVENAYATGSYKAAAGEVVSVTVSAPYSANLQVPVAANGTFKVNVPIKNIGDECTVAAGGSAVQVDNFVHYTKGGEKTTRILEGSYNPDNIIKSETAAWNELGSIYYTFTPDAAYLPENWDQYFKYLAGWQKKAGFEATANVTGTVMYPVETSFYKGAYEPKPYHFVKFSGIGGMTYVGVTAQDGTFSIPVNLQFSDDTPALAWDASVVSTDMMGTFKHFRKAGSETTVNWKGKYAYIKDVKAGNAAWNDLGIRYYGFTPDYTEGYDINSTEWAKYEQLAGWRVANFDEKTTITVEGTIKRAVEVKKGTDWEAGWEAAKNQRATITIASENLEVITNSSGQYRFTMKVVEALDSYLITVSPREGSSAFNHHPDPTKATGGSIAGKYVDAGGPTNVNIDVQKSASGNTYSVTNPTESRPSAKMIYIPTSAPSTWSQYSYNPADE